MMDMVRKFVTIGAITLGLMSFCFAEGDITYYGVDNGSNKISAINYSDVLAEGENYWAKSAIYEISSLGIMQGMDTRVFSPRTQVTNEQAITTILNSMGKSKEVNDLKLVTNGWSDKYIKYGMQNGLINEKTVLRLADIKGNLDAMKKKGVYVRDIAITREEMAQLITKAFSLSTSTTTDGKKPIVFNDAYNIDTDKKVYVDAVSQNGIMVGTDDNMFNPKSGLTRAELAQILKNCEGYILTNLGVVKHKGFIETVGASNVTVSNEDGANVSIDVRGRDIPTFRNNVLGGVSLLKSSDEVEYYVDSARCVKLINVIDASIYGVDELEQKKNEKQGIVLGNSPYFYEISIKDKNGNIEDYSYGRWTTIYKDGIENSASSIVAGDTVYLEFDELGDIITIRGVTNSIIRYATIIDIDDTVVKLVSEDGLVNRYDLGDVPVYRNGEEIRVKDLHKGEYAKLNLAQDEVLKVEIVLDDRTCEGIYKGYISEINLTHDRIIIRNPKKYEDDKWNSLEDSFISLPLDKNMQISYEGVSLSKEELDEKQVGKFAYIATREDTEVLERVKAINIGVKDKGEVIYGKVSKFDENTGILKIRDQKIQPVVDETTIIVIDDKIIAYPILEKNSKVSVIVAYEDGEYIAKVITTSEYEEARDVIAYFGKVTAIEEGSEVTMTVTARLDEDEWITDRERNVSFSISTDTRIFNDTEPLNFNEFISKDYKEEEICVIAYGDEAVVINTTKLTEEPSVIMGTVSDIEEEKIIVTDVKIYDIEEDEWTQSGDEDVGTLINTAITIDGRYGKLSGIKEEQEIIVIKADKLSDASVIMLKN